MDKKPEKIGEKHEKEENHKNQNKSEKELNKEEVTKEKKTNKDENSDIDLDKISDFVIENEPKK